MDHSAYEKLEFTTLGTTTERVLRHSSCSGLLVPGKDSRFRGNLFESSLRFDTTNCDTCLLAEKGLRHLDGHYFSSRGGHSFGIYRRFDDDLPAFDFLHPSANLQFTA